MKQTVEEAASECRRTTAQSMGIYAQYHSIDECPNHGITYDEIAESAFIKGAEWQSKQSPWINVNERLPEQFEHVLVLFEYEGVPMVQTDVYFGRINGDWEWKFGQDKILAWMPVPSFDEILEANKEVLKRIKEKRD